jgi:hypothetical protein
MPFASVRRLKGMTPGLVVLALWALPWAVNAQNAVPPTPAASSPGANRDIPRPDQLEPGVNTSAAPAATPAREAPGPAGQNGRAAGPGPATGVTPASPAAQTASGDSALPSVYPSSQGSAARASAAPRGSDSSQASAASRKNASGARAAKGPDRIELDPTDITGNRELPKVLYIVPWKRADLGDLMGKPVNSLLDEVLQPVDRDVFQRENRYYDGLKPDQAAPKAGAASGSENKP